MTENSPNMVVEDINLHIQKAEQTSNRINSKKSMPRCIKIKFAKTEKKDKILKAAREKHTFFYRGTTV